MIHAYRILNILSIDVAVGAAVCAAFFARILNVVLRPQGLVALGLTVWIIYTADHLLDAALVKHPAASNRHRFHQLYFWEIVVALLVVATADLVLAFFIRRPIAESALVFAFFVIVYIIFSRWLRYLKEFIGALLYTGGVLLPAWSIFEGELSRTHQVLIGQFGALVLINLVLFALLSHDQDVLDGQGSIVTAIGKRTTQILMTIMFTGSAILVIVVSPLGPEQWILLGMLLVLFLIFIFQGYFSRNERFRLAGDAIFLIPVISLLAG